MVMVATLSSILAVGFVAIWLPETQGMSVEEITANVREFCRLPLPWKPALVRYNAG